MIETIPEMRARYERTIADLQGQIERLTLDLHQASAARERAEKAADFWNLRYEQAWHEAHPMKQATTP